ncbi:electron transport complex subunit RsxC, partial [Candidatus Desantisbacteria bacterium CG_4_9_14_3_um_filter_50_7]
MNLKTFPGGIHPPESKHFTERKPIEDMPVPSLVVIPLQQHTGAPCEPLVKPGDEVKEGQKIGDSKSFVSAPLHSSISGKVSAIEPRPHPVIPKDVLSIVIEANSPQSTDHGQETTA